MEQLERMAVVLAALVDDGEVKERHRLVRIAPQGELEQMLRVLAVSQVVVADAEIHERGREARIHANRRPVLHDRFGPVRGVVEDVAEPHARGDVGRVALDLRHDRIGGRLLHRRRPFDRLIRAIDVGLDRHPDHHDRAEGAEDQPQRGGLRVGSWPRRPADGTRNHRGSFGRLAGGRRRRARGFAPLARDAGHGLGIERKTARFARRQPGRILMSAIGTADGVTHGFGL